MKLEQVQETPVNSREFQCFNSNLIPPVRTDERTILRGTRAKGVNRRPAPLSDMSSPKWDKGVFRQKDCSGRYGDRSKMFLGISLIRKINSDSKNKHHAKRRGKFRGCSFLSSQPGMELGHQNKLLFEKEYAKLRSNLAIAVRNNRVVDPTDFVNKFLANYPEAKSFCTVWSERIRMESGFRDTLIRVVKSEMGRK